MGSPYTGYSTACVCTLKNSASSWCPHSSAKSTAVTLSQPSGYQDAHTTHTHDCSVSLSISVPLLHTYSLLARERATCRTRAPQLAAVLAAPKAHAAASPTVGVTTAAPASLVARLPASHAGTTHGHTAVLGHVGFVLGLLRQQDALCICLSLAHIDVSAKALVYTSDVRWCCYALVPHASSDCMLP